MRGLALLVVLLLLAALASAPACDSNNGENRGGDNDDDQDDDDDDDDINRSSCPSIDAPEPTHPDEQFSAEAVILSPQSQWLYSDPQPVLLLNAQYELSDIKIWDWNTEIDAHSGFLLPRLQDGRHCLRVEGESPTEGFVRAYRAFEIRGSDTFQVYSRDPAPTNAQVGFDFDKGAVVLPQWLSLTNNGDTLVTGLRIVDPAIGDTSDVSAWVAEYTAGMSDQQAALALYDMVAVRMRNSWVPQNGEVNLGDPGILMNVYGYGLCGEKSENLAELWKLFGLNSRINELDGHVTTEVEYDGEWHVFDPFARFYINTADETSIASLQTLVDRPELVESTVDSAGRLPGLLYTADAYNALLEPPNYDEEPTEETPTVIRRELWPRETATVYYSGVGASYRAGYVEMPFASSTLRRDWSVLDPQDGLAPLLDDGLDGLELDLVSGEQLLHPTKDNVTGSWLIARDLIGPLLGASLRAVVHGAGENDSVIFSVDDGSGVFISALELHPQSSQEVYVDLSRFIDSQDKNPIDQLSIRVEISSETDSAKTGLSEMELVLLQQIGSLSVPAPHSASDKLIVAVDHNSDLTVALGVAQDYPQQIQSVKTRNSAAGTTVPADGRHFATITFRLTGSDDNPLLGGNKVALVSNRGSQDTIQRVWSLHREMFAPWRATDRLSPDPGPGPRSIKMGDDWLKGEFWDLIYMVRSTTPGGAVFTLELDGEPVPDSDVTIGFNKAD